MRRGWTTPTSTDLPTSLPLRHRLPNQSPVFVGRDRELAAVAKALERCPVAVVSGPSGVGKTALALRAIRAVPGFDLARALLVDLRPGTPVEDPRLQIIRVLARVQGLENRDWSGILNDDDAAGGTLIDLAESGGYWVVLDDLHHLDPAAAGAMLVLLARYARHSRWIVTSRTEPRLAELTPQVIALGGLSDHDLRQLAEAFMPHLAEEELSRAISASGGSPWILQQELAARDSSAATDRLIGGLPPGARAFLDALAVVDRALPLEALASFTTLPVTEVLTALEERGLIQRGYTGYRLHDVVRRIVAQSRSAEVAPPSPADAGRPLTTQDEPEAVLEGARLLLNAGEIEDVLRMLEATGDRLIDGDSAPRLWQLLALSNDSRLAPWRLRCAVALAQPGLLAQLAPPPVLDLDGRLLWARGLLIQGQVCAALEITCRLQLANDPGLAFRAGLLAVECLAADRRYAEAWAQLSDIEPPDEGSLALHESWRAYCLAATGRGEDATHALQRAQSRLDALPARVRIAVLLNVARVLGLLSRPGDAYAISRTVLATSLPNPKSLSIHFVITMDMGRYGEAGQILERLAPFRSERSLLRHIEAVHRAYHRFCVGDLAGLGETIAFWKDEILRIGDTHRLRALLGLETLYRMARAEPPAPEDPSDVIAEPRGMWAALYARRARARTGAPPHEASRPVDPRTSRAEVMGMFADIVEVDARIVRGTPVPALELCTRLLGELHDRGLGSVRVDLEHTYCDILLILGRWSELEEAAAVFSRTAASLPSARYKAEALFFDAFAPQRPVDWGLIELMATRMDLAPIAARRARFLLGDDALLDAVDRAVLLALRERRGVVPATSLIATAAPPASGQWEEAGWGLADEERRVWRPTGACFSFVERVQLWKILVALYERGGNATKEDLVRDVWQEPEYHPLHHDNRLQVAVRKLRRVIEEDPNRPALLVTTPEGYALSGRVRRARGIQEMQDTSKDIRSQ